MIQKVQKTVEILHVQFIDKVVEISEIMQSKDNCQRSRKVQKLVEVHRHNCGRSSRAERAVLVKCSSLWSSPTTGAKDAKMQKDPNVSPQASQTPSERTRFTRKSCERQSTERRRECLKHEREQYGSTRRVDQSISAHTGLSRGVPADHEVNKKQVQK